MSENKTLNKIDAFLNQLEEKKKKGKLPFLYQTEEYKIALEEGRDKEYEKVFRELAKKMGFDPEEVENLPKDKKKEFFNKLDSMWKAKKETD